MQRIRDYIKYLEGKIKEPKMADKPEEEPEIDPELRKDIANLLKKSHSLSNNIYQTEQEIKNLGVCITYTIFCILNVSSFLFRKNTVSFILNQCLILFNLFKIILTIRKKKN